MKRKVFSWISFVIGLLLVIAQGVACWTSFKHGNLPFPRFWNAPLFSKSFFFDFLYFLGYFLPALVGFVFFFSGIISLQKLSKTPAYKAQNTRRLVTIALMGTIAFVLIFINFGVPFLSPVAEFDLSALPELIGGFILGPTGAVAIIFLKLALKLIFQGTESMFTGEIQNFLLSVSYVLPAVFYYRRHRTKKGAAVGLVIGAVISVIVAVFTNLYIIFPFYIKLYGMNWDGIVAMFSAVNPWIKNIPTMVAFSVVPFNLISRTITAVLAFFTYKKLSVPLKKMIQ